MSLTACGFSITGGSAGDGGPPPEGLPDGAADDASIDAVPIDAMPIDVAPPAACRTDADYITRPLTQTRYRLGLMLSWTAARTACEEDGAHLVVIDDVAENTYVDGLSANVFWIGATDSVMEANWRWVTGVPLAGSFTSWRAGNPNNDGGVQHCAEMDGDSAGTWNDFSCATSQRYVCECEP